MVCTGGEDGIIRVWDCLTFALIDELSGHAGGLRALTIWEGLLCSMSGMREKGRLGTNLSYIMYFFIILYYIILYYIIVIYNRKQNLHFISVSLILNIFGKECCLR